MKVFLIMVSLILMAFATNAQTKGAVDSAYRIAQRMQDTLRLNDSKYQNIFNINMNLYQQKTLLILKNEGNTAAISTQLQMVENKRDSLYHTVLSDSLYFVYKQKKQNLVVPN